MVVQVKSNQENLYWSCQASDDKPDDTHISGPEKQHGRIENRRVDVYKNFKPLYFEKWDGMIQDMIKVTRIRSLLNTKLKQWDKSKEISYYISTTEKTAENYANIIRLHWSIENCNHYVRDTIFQEDASRIRINPMSMFILRSFALNICRLNHVTNVSNTLFENMLDFSQALTFVGLKK